MCVGCNDAIKYNTVNNTETNTHLVGVLVRVVCFVFFSAEAAQYKHQQSGETTPFYDPFKGWPKTEEAQEKMKMRELKNGRAAMLCWASFVSAALIPGSVPDFCLPF